MNNYEEAESLLLESKSIRELCFGEYHKEVRASLQSLAFMYTEMQKYENAESYFIRAKVLYDKFNDKLNADYSSMKKVKCIIYMSNQFERKLIMVKLAVMQMF
ncbi:MAG: tetratricopeptide repeat protein [Saprospiraceae bacterium]|nr:tetratricopeptide repeat protein [Saprospiraceae bacterium]